MADYWIKLYIEILEDPKMGTLPANLWQRFIQLCLLAGKYGKAGELPDTQQLAWALRMNTDDLNHELHQLASTGMIEPMVNGWLVVNFAKRQAAVPAKERMLQMRERQHKQQYYDGVTPTLRDVTQINRLTDNRLTDTETEKRAIPTSSFSQSETAEAISQFGNNGAREAEHLYQSITGQISMPGLGSDAAREDLANILDYYGHDFSKAEAAGKPIFAVWCNTRGKNGRNYSPVNPAWTTKWLESLADRPKVNTVNSIAEKIAREIRANQ
jgi:hypothetical protein